MTSQGRCQWVRSWGASCDIHFQNDSGQWLWVTLSGLLMLWGGLRHSGQQYSYLALGDQLCRLWTPLQQKRWLDYGRVKEAILHNLTLSPEAYQRWLWKVSFSSDYNPRLTAQKIRVAGLRWLRPVVQWCASRGNPSC